MFRSLVIVF